MRNKKDFIFKRIGFDVQLTGSCIEKPYDLLMKS